MKGSGRNAAADQGGTMTSTSHWRPLGRVGFERLREARMQAYYAAQWLARAARAYIPARPDDGHTNLGWDNAFDGFTTHPIKDLRLGLRVPDLTLALVDHDSQQSLPSFSLNGRREAEVRDWLGGQFETLGLPAKALDAPLPYELPAHVLATGGAYSAATLAEPLCELAAWYSNGFCALGSIMQRLVARGLPAPEVRCWPHHFDLDCLTAIHNGSAGTTPTMGAGFSPGDHYYEEPYFYISLYPRPDVAALPRLPALGHWHTDDFMAALVPASRIVAAKDRQAETEAFLHAAADGIVKVLSGGAAARVNDL
jgi:hypothetical protein